VKYLFVSAYYCLRRLEAAKKKYKKQLTTSKETNEKKTWPTMTNTANTKAKTYA